MKTLILLSMILLYGCSSPGTEDKTPAAPKEPAYEVYTVEIKGMKFVPDTITVNKGDRIIFVNRDMVAHCITEEATKAWTSSPIPSGEDWMHVADKSADYYCAIHQVMKGKIIVR